ncbi:MAG: hypothetical protein AB7O52_08760 [Planctomycetota bacterium]
MPDPLHPATVHLPLALSLLMPLAAGAAMVAVMRCAALRPVWWVVIVLQTLLCVSTLVAIETGEQEKSVVAAFVPADALARHEDRAESFHQSVWVCLAIAGLGLFPGRPGRLAMIATILASSVAFGLAWRTGEAGAELVYVHGAANAYK